MDGKVILRSAVTPIERRRTGEAAMVLATLLDLKREQAYDTGISDSKRAGNLRTHIRQLAQKEGVTVGAGWTSTKTLALWVETVKKPA